MLGDGTYRIDTSFIVVSHIFDTSVNYSWQCRGEEIRSFMSNS